MSARPAPSPSYGARRAKPKRPELKLVNGGAAFRAAKFSPRVRLLAMFAFGGALLFGVVAFHVVLSQGQFQLQKLNARADNEQAAYQKARLEIAELESPSRITRVAQERLGMVPADKVTPVTPGVNEMPRTRTGATSSTSGPTTEDPGSWTAVKPHLNSSSQ